MPDSRTEPRNTLPPLTRLLMVAETIEELFSDDADVLCEVHAELATELEHLRGIKQRALESMQLPHDDEALFVLQYVLNGED
jgi:hypothetical protein